MQYHLLMMVLLNIAVATLRLPVNIYFVGNMYFDLAQTQQHFQTIVKLAHARPAMSCMYLVM